MSKPTWIFQLTPRMGGATGEAYNNPLLGTGLDPAAVLAREAIQNSVDAHVGSEKVRIEFRKVTLLGKEKQDFVRTLSLKPTMTSRYESLKLPRETCLTSLDDLDAPLTLLYIEDYETHGLYGDPHDPESHFFRLLLSLGDSAKSHGKENSGGSYGFGKSVYSSNSRIHTLIAYSAFTEKGKGAKPNHYARLMGCSFFNNHKHDGKAYSGRAWFGKPLRNTKDEVDPLTDDPAHEYAKRLGFRLRTASTPGTSILIVDCGVECENLRESIEEWWWPRLLDDEQGLDVVLYEQEKRLQPPKPRKRPDLRPFIECFELAVGRTVPIGKHQKADTFNKVGDIPIGQFGFSVVGDESKDLLGERIGTIALIRSPRMVIEYMPVGGVLPLPCVGAFVAAMEIDNTLKRSEPASHNKWDHKSARLDELGPEARDTVSAVLRRLKASLQRFAREAAPESSKQELRLKSLERLLGSIFKPPTTLKGGGGGSSSDPIEIHFVDQPHCIAEEKLLTTRGSFKVALSEDADREKIRISLHVRCLVKEDESLSTDDPISVTIQSKDIELIRDLETDGKVYFDLERDSRPLFTFRSGKYSPDWTTYVQVNVEEQKP